MRYKRGRLECRGAIGLIAGHGHVQGLAAKGMAGSRGCYVVLRPRARCGDGWQWIEPGAMYVILAALDIDACPISMFLSDPNRGNQYNKV